MYTSIAPILGWIVLVAILALAWLRGGAAERIGALIVLVSAACAVMIHLLAPKAVQAPLLLIDEVFVAVSFLALALRYMSVWLGAAMILQAVQFSLHAYYLIGELPRDHFYAVVNNLDSLGVLLCILIGTLLAWRKRAQLAK
ncbi:hypothetical protein [uncultured Caulobacter sp.]|jgi:hypothetical protein|uniref:hypothetical protein n=1 Tax=uncultured Caulobacter sp. TaxID=158749 RepID=UPI00260CE483|nr:hypothetical protein [uncultured Caulobacter sp.]